MSMPNGPSWLLAVIAVAPALILFAASGLVSPSADPFRIARRAVAWSALCTVIVAIAVAAGLSPAGSGADGSAGVLLALLRRDALTASMLVLVAALAAVIVRFSASYLRNEPGRARYERALLRTLGCVNVIVISNNLLLMAFAWVGASFALHQLLTFYRDRPQALVAAHKKFILSRLADACVLTAIVLIDRDVGSVNLDVINAWAQSHGELSPFLHAAATLLVVAVCLKSAQLPFHGWLTQVMEAPTPVSALLHAGIVNIGGFVLIRMAPFMAHAAVAQTLLVVVGTTTAVVAALVMTTRVSIKVALAWSTCAQMGFMLLECGLGAWQFALLHLLAHSIYKAHAFLGSGGAVHRWRLDAMAQPPRTVSFSRAFVAPIIVVAALFAGALVARGISPSSRLLDEAFAPLLVVFVISVVPWGVRAAGQWTLVLRVIGIAAACCGWHAVLTAFVPTGSSAALGSARGVIVVGGFIVLFVLDALLASLPESGLSRALQPRLFAGFHLDELFTRMTFRIWPPFLPREDTASTLPTRLTRSHEVRS